MRGPLDGWAELVAQVNGRTLVGMRGVRDPDCPCEGFVPGEPSGSEHGCSTDGHYLCDECIERATCEDGCGKRPMYCECDPEAVTR